ncbi:MAG: VWA domain-containing protein [Gemmatimonadales bacterium]
MLVVDASASMAWSGAPGHLTKLDYSTRLAAALALVLLRQHDAAGLITFDETVRSITPARARSRHWAALARVLMHTDAGSGTAAEPALRQVVSALRARGLVVFISDLLLDRALTLKALKYLRHRGHHVLVLHVADPAELELDQGDETRFRDPESESVVTLAPTEWADAYRRTVQGVVRAWGEACRAAGIRYALLPTDVPFGVALGRALRA